MKKLHMGLIGAIVLGLVGAANAEDPVITRLARISRSNATTKPDKTTRKSETTRHDRNSPRKSRPRIWT